MPPKVPDHGTEYPENPDGWVTTGEYRSRLAEILNVDYISSESISEDEARIMVEAYERYTGSK